METPTNEPSTCFIKLRPTWSELFASPSGCLSFVERSKSAEELTAPHETTTMSPVNMVIAPLTSATTPVTSRPEALVCSRNTFASVTSVMLGSRIAGRTALISESDFACTMHG